MCLNKWKEKLGGGDDCYDSKSSANEEGKRFSIKPNSKQSSFCRVIVDDCLIPSSNEKKCDFLFIQCQTEEFYFVELKGSEIVHAINQISNTIDILKRKLKDEFPLKFYAYVVCRRLPKAANTKVNKAKKAFLAKYKQPITVHSNGILQIREK